MIWRHGSSFALCLPALLLAQALVSDDEWQLKGCLGEEWRWFVDKPWDAPLWLPA